MGLRGVGKGIKASMHAWNITTGPGNTSCCTLPHAPNSVVCVGGECCVTAQQTHLAGGAVPDHHLGEIAALDKVAGHGTPHDAQACR